MKKVLAVLLAGLLLATFAYAGDDIVPAAKAGSKSLNFLFGGLGQFNIGGSGPAGGLGVTYFMSSEAALRLGFQLSSTSQTTKAPSVPANGKDQTQSAFNLGVAGDYLMYMNSGRVRPYMGAGLSFTLNSGDQKYTPVTFNNQTFTPDELKTGGITFGLQGIAGAEFFIYNEISLSAEYQLNLININSPSDTEVTVNGTTTKTPGTSHTNILGLSGGWLMAHIYF